MSPTMQFVLAAALTGIIALLVHSGLRRSRARNRLLDAPLPESTEEFEPENAGLVGWLRRAGLRDRSDPARFVWSQIGAVVLAGAAAFGLAKSPLVTLGRESLLSIPGGGGRLLEPVLLASPVVVFLLVAALPAVRVRRLRAQRLRYIEQDLPLMLELMASLAQSGLGFDAALGRLVKAQDSGRPLIVDLRAFQRDILAGLPRLKAFERLGERAAAPGLDTLVAALIHAEQLGASIATTLRNQADEAWNERKERLLARSQSLPTRLAAPLVVCFLPGLLVVTLAPALVRFSELVTGVLDGNN